MKRGLFVRRTAALGSAFCLFREDRVVNSLRHTAVPDQAIEGLLIQKVERSHYHICRQKLAILAYADAFHSGSAGCFDAVLRVFYNDAMLRRDTQSGGGYEEHFRVRLAPVYIVSGHDGLKEPASV